MSLSSHGLATPARVPIPIGLDDGGDSDISREAASLIVRRFFDAVEALDADVIASLLHPSVVYRRPGRPVIIGRPAVVDYYMTDRPAHTSSILVDDLLFDRGAVVALGLVEGLSREGIRLSERFADVFRFSDGLIRDRTTYFYRTGF